MPKRKKKRGVQLECTCLAYPFPHRLGGGRCSGEEWAAHQRMWGDSRVCITCPENEGHTCAPAEGRESIKYCEIYRQMLDEVR